MKLKHQHIGLLAVAIFITFSACGGETTEQPPADDGLFFDSPEAAHAAALERGDHLLSDALEDGEISRREYEILAQRNLECYLDSGLATQSGDTIWDPISNLSRQTPLDYRDPPASAAEAEELNGCLIVFDYPDMLFQTSNEPRMNDDLLAYVRACLKDKGFETQEDATWLGNLVGPDASELPNHMGIDECVMDGARELYPDLQVINIAY